MPRVKEVSYIEAEKKTYAKIKGAMGLRNLKQKDIANELGLHESTVSQHFANRTFSYLQLLQIFEIVGLECENCLNA